jgi:uncharacterized DUF497 family protein
VALTVEGFDWDKGNRAKCLKHGVSIVEVEGVFRGPLLVGPDVKHSQDEERQWAIGKTDEGRWVFLVFTIRERGGKRLIRPISARYMHKKEVEHYEEENPGL